MSAPELVRYGEVASTQDALHALAERGAPAGTAVVADVQTSGRGSRGREWRSPAGGLWLSVLYRPDDPAAVEVLSLRIGLAAAAALARAGVERVRLKWPNDLMLGERKFGGILCEARWQGERPAWVAAGIGLNVTNPVPRDARTAALALGELFPGLTVAMVFEPLLAALRTVGEHTGPLSALEIAAFEARDWLRGRTLREPVAGVADGVDADGALRVRTADGTLVAARSGSVVLAA
ncbi:MAG TPA: biotin--[acetyl-CoA-carboxylase] ligase [Gemmatimonadales bacterium]|nr:biotin--[acetyl-CoA-carboxylase] ligase [Gemmatimonadales bacterium]